jgi:protoheme IX farnesyltransferase
MAVAPLVACTFATRLSHPRLFPIAAAALGLVMVDAVIGGVVYVTGDPAWAGVLHLVLAALAFAASAVLTVRTLMEGERERVEWGDYVTLTKPRIMVLLLVTAVGAMFAAAGGMPPLAALLALITGGAAASGGASALNHVLDRDIDKVMPRTKTRPVAAGRVTVAAAAEFGLALSAFSFVIMAGVLNLLAASLALAGNLFYVLVYTGFLKRKTALNIVIGGAAGAVPPLAGWAAGAGHLDPLAFILFAIIFFWTPPHFWALALLIKRDYDSVGVPMLPVTRGDKYTVRRIVAYAVLTVAITVTPWVFGMLGLAYLAAVLVLGGTFVALTIRLWANPSKRAAGLVFHFSLLYLALLFVAVAVGATLT